MQWKCNHKDMHRQRGEEERGERSSVQHESPQAVSIYRQIYSSITTSQKQKFQTYSWRHGEQQLNINDNKNKYIINQYFFHTCLPHQGWRTRACLAQLHLSSAMEANWQVISHQSAYLLHSGTHTSNPRVPSMVSLCTELLAPPGLQLSSHHTALSLLFFGAVL